MRASIAICRTYPYSLLCHAVDFSRRNVRVTTYFMVGAFAFSVSLLLRLFGLRLASDWARGLILELAAISLAAGILFVLRAVLDMKARRSVR